MPFAAAMRASARDAVDVRSPRIARPDRRLGGIDRGVGRGVDDGVVVAPAARRLADPERVRSRSARVGVLDMRGIPELGAECAARAARSAPMTRIFRGAIGVTSARRGCARSFAEISTSAERDRPRDRGRLVREVEERVLGVRRPVVVDEIRVGGVRFERLIRVADAAGDEDRPGRVDLGGEHGAEGRTLAEVDPRAEDAAGRDRHPLVPRLRVDAAGRARPRR